MKLYALLLASLAANAALLTTFAFRPALAPVPFRSYFESTAVKEERQAAERTRAEQAAQAAAKRAAAARSTLWSELKTDDLRTLVQRLRAAGFPADVIRTIVATEIERRFSSQLKSLNQAAFDAPYWETRPMGYFTDPALLAKRNELNRERTRVMREVLGDEALAGPDQSGDYNRSRYGNLPRTKIDLIERIEADYREMDAEVRAAMRGITLPEDREKMALLQREKKADLAAILNPEELQDYEMRTSNVTSRLRPALSLLDASEAEFRAIYQAHGKYEDILFPGPGTLFGGADTRSKREEAEKQIAIELAAALGETRAKEFMRYSDNEYQQLANAAKGAGLPLDAATRAYDLRAAAAAESQRIGDNRELSGDEKRTALRQVAENTRAQLINVLGPTAGAAYGNASWLRAIERGSVVTFGRNWSSYRSVAPSRTPNR